ncbi:gluconate 2-dehydrogenase subunit 3 family protein [Ohtaekwangia sp.]|uniref:gluconate 2-dehydrogenase subunit 3 family protein n=1 Tax=Ohtaekwangia sp. TaxID=2066019 RepID=UPI002FDE7785
MNRREILQRTAMVLGYAITGPALTGLLQGCKAAPDLNYTPAFFTKEQALLVAELAEVLIPKTSTPGAKDAGVPAFIDGMLHEVYPQADKDRVIKGLTAFDEEAKKTYGDAFALCKPEEQKALVKKHHEEALSKGAGDASFGWWRAGSGGEKPFILEMKELTLIGFFTSQPGATEVLQYNQAPGPFKGCVPLTEVGKAWAT